MGCVLGSGDSDGALAGHLPRGWHGGLGPKDFACTPHWGNSKSSSGSFCYFSLFNLIKCIAAGILPGIRNTDSRSFQKYRLTPGHMPGPGLGAKGEHNKLCSLLPAQQFTGESSDR